MGKTLRLKRFHFDPETSGGMITNAELCLPAWIKDSFSFERIDDVKKQHKTRWVAVQRRKSWKEMGLPQTSQWHGVWKLQKKSHSILRAKRATFIFWVDKSSLKMSKIVHFGEFLKTWSLRSNSVTRQVSFYRTKIGGKCQKFKNSNATFWVIFKQCALANFQLQLTVK